MDYKTMRNQIEDMVNDNHKDFVKAVISMERLVNPGKALNLPDKSPFPKRICE